MTFCVQVIAISSGTATILYTDLLIMEPVSFQCCSSGKCLLKCNILLCICTLEVIADKWQFTGVGVSAAFNATLASPYPASCTTVRRLQPLQSLFSAATVALQARHS